VLEIIAKILGNLKNKIYFPSPEFEHIVRSNADNEFGSATLATTRAPSSADTASKAAIAAAAACKSAVAENMRLTAFQKEIASMPTASKLRTASRCELPQGVPMKNTATCPASPELIRSYYDVRSSGQYPDISVLSCVTNTKIQSTNYPITPTSWPKQPLFCDHSNVSYI